MFIISAFISFFRFIYIIGSYSLLLLTILFSFVNHSGLGFPFGVVWLFLFPLFIELPWFSYFIFSSEAFLTLAVSGCFVYYYFLGSFCFFVVGIDWTFGWRGTGKYQGSFCVFFLSFLRGHHVITETKIMLDHHHITHI